VSRGTRAATDRRVLLGNEGGWWPDRIRCRRSSWIKVRSKNRLGLAVYRLWNVHDVHDRHSLLLFLCTSVPRRIRRDRVVSTRRVRAFVDENGLHEPSAGCYSWITGISDVAFVVFVRKHQPEIQYLKTSISEDQRREFGRLVETSVSQIEAGQFVSTVASAFPKTVALAAAIWGCASITSN
jgi:hypothetical protein